MSIVSEMAVVAWGHSALECEGVRCTEAFSTFDVVLGVRHHVAGKLVVITILLAPRWYARA